MAIQNPFLLHSQPKQNPLDFLSTLPVLVAFPILVITANFSVLPTPTPWPHVARALVLCFQASVVLVFAGLIVKEKSKSSLYTLASLILFYVALLLLPATRVSILFFGLFLNAWNPYTLIALVYDLYENFQNVEVGVNVGVTLAGYVGVIGSFILLKSLSLPTGKSKYGVLAASAVGLVFFVGSVNFPLVFMNLAAALLLLFLVQEAKLRSRLNILVIGLFSYCLEVFVLNTGKVSFSGIVISVVLPLIIRIDHSAEATSSEAPLPHILTELLRHSDTRAIFNFLLLNTAFMFVQLLYSFRSKSLGLLSDSLHMALDCASLALGLVAGVMLKHPVNSNGKYPFGLRNFEILAGFTNGTLLVGISGSIIFEAVGRLFRPVALQQTTELIIVSVLGLLVNLVGIFAFNHGHAHSHGAPEEEHDSHSHSHSHSHSEHSHSELSASEFSLPEFSASEHSHSGHSASEHSHAVHPSEHSEHSTKHSHSQSQAHDGCDAMNDNMRGIFLHILADTLGSVGVVISTILTKFFSWQGFDPVASIIIAVLIFLTAIPLMKSTASTLLLRLNSAKEGNVRSVLNDISTIKGIKSFTTPRFWPASSKLRGYIHIQVYRGENGLYLKKQCEEVFRAHSIDAMIQMENDYDPCWCRP